MKNNKNKDVEELKHGKNVCDAVYTCVRQCVTANKLMYWKKNEINVEL